MSFSNPAVRKVTGTTAATTIGAGNMPSFGIELPDSNFEDPWLSNLILSSTTGQGSKVTDDNYEIDDENGAFHTDDSDSMQDFQFSSSPSLISTSDLNNDNYDYISELLLDDNTTGGSTSQISTNDSIRQERGRASLSWLSTYYETWGMNRAPTLLRHIYDLCHRVDAPPFWLSHGYDMLRNRIKEPLANRFRHPFESPHTQKCPSGNTTVITMLPRKKRRRVRFSYHVIEELKASFRSKAFPNREDRIRLAAQLQLTEEQINNWFTNARSRAKRKQDSSKGEKPSTKQ